MNKPRSVDYYNDDFFFRGTCLEIKKNNRNCSLYIAKKFEIKKHKIIILDISQYGCEYDFFS